MDRSFRAAPRPNDEVVDMIERALRAAKSGRARTATIVLVTHQKVEHASAGEMGPGRITSLIGGLSEAAHELLAKGAAAPEDPDVI